MEVEVDDGVEREIVAVIGVDDVSLQAQAHAQPQSRRLRLRLNAKWKWVSSEGSFRCLTQA